MKPSRSCSQAIGQGVSIGPNRARCWILFSITCFIALPDIRISERWRKSLVPRFVNIKIAALDTDALKEIMYSEIMYPKHIN